MKSLLRQLTSIPLEKPCDAEWTQMHGDDRVRRCDECARDVYDLTAMTAHEAEIRLLNAGTPAPCIRYVRNVDGSIAHRREASTSSVLPRRASKAAATTVTIGLSLAAATAQAKDDGKQPAQCVAYAPATPVAAALNAAPAAPSPNAPTPPPSPEPPPQPLGGAPMPAKERPKYGTLQVKSKTARTVTLIGITLNAPLPSYFLTPGDFIADVKDPDGRVRQVKFTIKQDKTTVVDLDAPQGKK